MRYLLNDTCLLWKLLNVGKGYEKSLNKEAEGIVKLACEVVETGKDVFDIKAKKLDSICNDINEPTLKRGHILNPA